MKKTFPGAGFRYSYEHQSPGPFDANAAPAMSCKGFAISVKTGLTSFGKVDLPFHAPISQQSIKNRRHSSTGFEFYDHQENTFTPKKSSVPKMPTLSPKF